ncbi:MAG: hypothetical protein H0W68_13845 [Gemmatimonadaceae bacterium]|nr:hypothetical protein [Gemmatimonadaceae bacterium]
MIIFRNGAFGLGKTTVARALVRRSPEYVLFDPELIGLALQRSARLVEVTVDDFQELRAWRWLTIAGLRVARVRWRKIVVPMAISRPEYLAELRRGIARFEPRLCHVCRVASIDVVHARLRIRGADPSEQSWQFRRAADCCAVHGGEAFAVQIDASLGTPDDLAGYVLDQCMIHR